MSKKNYQKLGNNKSNDIGLPLNLFTPIILKITGSTVEHID